MIAAWRWVSDHPWQLLLGVGGIAVAIIGYCLGADLNAGEMRQVKLDEIDASKKAKKLEAELGHERAVAEIEKEHAAEVAEMEADSAERVDKLRRNPSELARASLRWRRKKRNSPASNS